MNDYKEKCLIDMDKKREYLQIIEGISTAVEKRGHSFLKPFSIAVIIRSLELYKECITLFGISNERDLALYEEIF